MSKIPQMDIRTLCAVAVARIAAVTFCIVFIAGCTAVTWFDTPSGRTAKAHCRTFADDGASCVEWSEVASDAMVGKYHPASYCCVGWGNKCPLTTTGAKGFQCTCAVPTPYGLNYIPGQACD